MIKSHIEVDPRLGRCLVATESLQRGDVVVDELPFALGPKHNSGIVCLGCYRYLQFDEDGDSMDRCEQCDWPLCSACADNIEHRGECAIFSSAKIHFAGNVSENGICTQLDCITPLRVLLAMEADPERWRKEIEPMEYHEMARRQMTEVWDADLINVAKYLRGPCKLERFSEELIMRIVGILEVNAFEARTLQGHPLRGLYPITAILAHNCVPNTARAVYPSEDYRIRLRAMRNIDAGEQLQHSYTFTLNGTAQRQQDLRVGKFFMCECQRCRDPSELGTYFSSFKCNKCQDGWILPTKPLDSSVAWKCNICESQTANATIQKAIGVMQTEVTDVQSIPDGAERLQDTEKLMRKYRSILHPLHFILTGLRQNLIEMYGRVSGYEMVELPDVLLERKEELCRQVLRILNVFEPGLSRSRAMMLYEQHVPLVLLAKSAFIAGILTPEGLRDKLLQPVAILKECVDILQYEDAASQEGALGKVAKQALEQLSLSVEGLRGE